MVGKIRIFGTHIWRATNGGTSREYFFVCLTGVEYIDRRFETGKSAGVVGDRE